MLGIFKYHIYDVKNIFHLVKLGFIYVSCIRIEFELGFLSEVHWMGKWSFFEPFIVSIFLTHAFGEFMSYCSYVHVCVCVCFHPLKRQSNREKETSSPTIGRTGPGQSQELELSLGLPMGGRGPSIWVTFCFLGNWMGKRVTRTQSSTPSVRDGPSGWQLNLLGHNTHPSFCVLLRISCSFHINLHLFKIKLHSYRPKKERYPH